MASHVLRNLGSDDIIAFLLEHGCYLGRMQGDDQVFYHPKDPVFGLRVQIKRKRRRGEMPIATVNKIIRNLESMAGVTREQWIDWLNERKRGIKKTGE